MDTRLKSSRSVRVILAILAIIAVVLGNFYFFPLIGENVQKEQEESAREAGIDEERIRDLIQESYVLYYEATEAKQEYPEYLREMMESWNGVFYEYRFEVDYCLLTEEKEFSFDEDLLKNILEVKWAEDARTEEGQTSESQTDESQTGELQSDELQTDELQPEKLQGVYKSYIILSYDENGILTIENVWDSKRREDDITRIIQENASQEEFYSELKGWYEEWYTEEFALDEGTGKYENSDTNRESEIYEKMTKAQKELEALNIFPKNCRVLYAIPTDSYVIDADAWYHDYWGEMYLYSRCGGGVLFGGSLIVLAIAALILTSKFIWRRTIDYNRRGLWYLAEAAVIGIVCVIVVYDTFIYINRSYVDWFGMQSLSQVIQEATKGSFMDNLQQIWDVLELAAFPALVYAGWYVCLIVIRPLFSLGPIKYIQQYSLLYLIISKAGGWCVRWFKKIRDEVNHLDFSKKTMKTIRKVVIINFVVLTVISCFWFFGSIALIIYSIVLFWLIKRQYDRVEKDYQSLLEATSHMARGDLQYEDEKDWGVFEPFKEEIAKIRTGFSTAVEEEVKSQRMKAELITNVSHDLKTPLTAITTYVELLKDPDITEKQRKSYIEILERKSLRLKVLVEDLFEVSKATSNTIKLDMMEVDVVNLLKQVCVEHEERFTSMGLSVKWKLPEEKVLLMLDNQKTWRIFENLFLNIEKYAMPNSRVFVEITKGEQVQIVIKNISAQELSVSGAEITERFVRGDASRSTEGAGLGLAIAKSFTEAQGGTFEVTVDGDLFKVTILLK